MLKLLNVLLLWIIIYGNHLKLEFNNLKIEVQMKIHNSYGMVLGDAILNNFMKEKKVLTLSLLMMEVGVKDYILLKMLAIV